MRWLALALLAAGCAPVEPQAWVEELVDRPASTAEVVGAVRALPECVAVPEQGHVLWGPRPTCGTPPAPADGCLRASPLRIELAYAGNAWESELALHLCRVCGYTDGAVADRQARACASRARYLATAAKPLASSAWTEETSFPRDTAAVVTAVAALPECLAVRKGGVIKWRARVVCGGGQPAAGCSYPFERPRRIEVTYVGSAWDRSTFNPHVSTLAHELCHTCGHLAEPDADACALRAQAAAGR